MSTLQLAAQPREITGRKVKDLRAAGSVPVVVYGKSQEPLNLQVDARELLIALRDGGTSQLVQLTVEGGGNHNVLIREVQRDPVRRFLLHADFYAVNMLEKQQVSVTIVPVGETEAVVTGLMVLQAMDQVEVEALPSNIPAVIEVDISELTMENSITVADLPVIEGVDYLDEENEAVFTLITTRAGEADEDEEEELLEEGAEPEVLTRGKQEEDDDE